MSENYFNQVSNDDLSIKDVVEFLVEFWKVIVVAGIAGVIAAVVF